MSTSIDSDTKTIKLPKGTPISVVFAEDIYKPTTMKTTRDVFFKEYELDKISGIYEYFYDGDHLPIYKDAQVSSIVFFKNQCKEL